MLPFAATEKARKPTSVKQSEAEILMRLLACRWCFLV